MSVFIVCVCVGVCSLGGHTLFLCPQALSEELPLPIPPALQATLEDDCFWILRRGKVELVHFMSCLSLMVHNIVADIATATERGSTAERVLHSLPGQSE